MIKNCKFLYPNSRQGFTLVELLIVMAVIGGISGIFMTSFPATQKRSRDTARINDLRQYQASLENYTNKNDESFGFYPSRNDTGVQADTALCADIGLDNCAADPKDGQNICTREESGLCRYFYQSDGSGSGNVDASIYYLYARLEQPESTGSPYAVVCSNGHSGVADHLTTNGQCPITQVVTTPIPTSVSATTVPTSAPIPTSVTLPTTIPTNIPPVNTPIPTPVPSNLIANPGFESGTSSWSFVNNGSGNFTTTTSGVYQGTRSANVNFSSIGSNMQLYQAGITLEPNTVYRVSFAARSSSGNNMWISILKHTSPYTNYGLSYTPNLSNSWQTFTKDFTTSGFLGNVNDARLMFISRRLLKMEIHII